MWETFPLPMANSIRRSISSSYCITKMNVTLNTASPKNRRKRKKTGGNKLVRITLRGETGTRGDPLVRVTLVEDEVPQHLPEVEKESLTLPPARNSRLSSRVRSEQHPGPLPLLVFLGRAKTQKNGSQTGTRSA